MHQEADKARLRLVHAAHLLNLARETRTLKREAGDDADLREKPLVVLAEMIVPAVQDFDHRDDGVGRRRFFIAGGRTLAPPVDRDGERVAHGEAVLLLETLAHVKRGKDIGEFCGSVENVDDGIVLCGVAGGRVVGDRDVIADQALPEHRGGGQLLVTRLQQIDDAVFRVAADGCLPGDCPKERAGIAVPRDVLAHRQQVLEVREPAAKPRRFARLAGLASRRRSQRDRPESLAFLLFDAPEERA